MPCRRRPVASLLPIRPVRRIPDWKVIRAFRESLPSGGTTAAESVRKVRDSRY